jgi:hypothetical protein
VVDVSMRRPLRRDKRTRAMWESGLERYRRAVERYGTQVAAMPERGLRHELLQLRDPLEAVLEDFEDAVKARTDYDDERASAVLGCIHRAATLCAHATEAALMANNARFRVDAHDLAQSLDTVRILVKKIDELGDEVRPER